MGALNVALLCSARDLLRPGAGVSRRISVGELSSRAGPCDVPALSLVDPDLATRIGVLVGLHALGDDLGTRPWPKSTRERQRSPHGVSDHLGHDAAVQFDDAGGGHQDVSQRREPRSQVVDREAQTPRAQWFEHS